MFFEKAVPEAARDAFRRDAWAGIMGGAYTGAIFPFVGFIARDRLGAGVALIGIMTAAPFIGNMFALLYANMMEGKRKMPFVVWSQVIARFLFIFMLFATTPFTFALLVSSAQIIATIASPAYAVVLKEIYPDEHRGRIMAYIRVGLAFTTLLATQLVGHLLRQDMIGYTIVFPIAGVFGIASAIAFGTIKTAPVDPKDPGHAKLPTPKFLVNTLNILRDDRNYKWFAISVFTFGFGHLLIVPVFPIFQVDVLHITAPQVAILSNIATFVWMFSYFYWGKYVDVKSPLKAVLINVLLVSLIPVNYFFATNVWHLVPSAIISGVTMGGVELSYFNTILRFAQPGRESQYQALHSFLLGIRGTVAPLVGAAVVLGFKNAQVDIRYVFLMSMAIMLAGASMQYFGVTKRNG